VNMFWLLKRQISTAAATSYWLSLFFSIAFDESTTIVHSPV
jgi:hypothetical protein